jgi:hypothetical protein
MSDLEQRLDVAMMWLCALAVLGAGVVGFVWALHG